MAVALNTPARKTVFVVGAGAGKDVNLPVGAELKAAIAHALFITCHDPSRRPGGEIPILDAIRIAAKRGKPTQHIKNLFEASRQIARAMPQAISIDHFLDARRDDKDIELCGKLAIVYTILKAEEASLLSAEYAHKDPRLEFAHLEQTWYNSLFQVLTENCRAADLETRFASVGFVIFNYDRCVEHYLHRALQNYYAMSAADAAAKLKCLTIYHPYGTVGPLPWCGAKDGIEFGYVPGPERLLELAGQIKTFTEGTDQASSDIEAIRSAVGASDDLVFLGFAFHRLNLDLLLGHVHFKEARNGRRIFATALGISNSDVAVIRNDLMTKVSAIHPEDIQLRDLSCHRLFGEFRRSMALV